MILKSKEISCPGCGDCLFLRNVDYVNPYEFRCNYCGVVIVFSSSLEFYLLEILNNNSPENTIYFDGEAYVLNQEFKNLKFSTIEEAYKILKSIVENIAFI